MKVLVVFRQPKKLDHVAFLVGKMGYETVASHPDDLDEVFERHADFQVVISSGEIGEAIHEQAMSFVPGIRTILLGLEEIPGRRKQHIPPTSWPPAVGTVTRVPYPLPIRDLSRALATIATA